MPNHEFVYTIGDNEITVDADVTSFVRGNYGSSVSNDAAYPDEDGSAEINSLTLPGDAEFYSDGLRIKAGVSKDYQIEQIEKIITRIAEAREPDTYKMAAAIFAAGYTRTVDLTEAIEEAAMESYEESE